ncbi:MAG: hypothetical protein EBR01_10285 [Proteobacteria bacterium]|nr:hypothetical protein [Pseudomonadota bacterium]
MKHVLLLALFLSHLTSWGDEKIPKQHQPDQNSENLAISLNPSGTFAAVVGRRSISGLTPVGTFELIRLKDGMSEPVFSQALDPSGQLINLGHPLPSDAGVLYIRATTSSSSQTDCTSVVWKDDNEAWLACTQRVASGSTPIQPLFLVRIKPNAAQKISIFRTVLGGGQSFGMMPNTSNNFFTSSSSLLVDERVSQV